MEVITYGNTNEVIKEIFGSLLSRYQIGLETSMRGSDFVFDGINLIYHKCHKISFKRGGSHIESSDWIKHKKEIINPKTKDDKCFQYASTVALNSDKIKKVPQRVLDIKPFTNKYNWDGIKYP